MTAADVTRLRRELSQRDAMIERLAVQNDTQALTIERYQRTHAAKDRKIEDLTGQRDHWRRKAERLEAELDRLQNPKTAALEAAEEVFKR